MGALCAFLMRESVKYTKAHLPQDSYEEWLKSQVARPTQTRHEEKMAQDYYEAWMTRHLAKKGRRSGS